MILSSNAAAVLMLKKIEQVCHDADMFVAASLLLSQLLLYVEGMALFSG